MPKLDAVQDTHDDHQGYAGSGFVVRDDDGRLVATFGFLTKGEATAAHQKMQEVLAACRYAKGYA
jgi:hypothetical protein